MYLNCKCGALRSRHGSCLRCICVSEAWGRCPSDYNLLQSCVSSSKFCLWWRREKRLSWGQERERLWWILGIRDETHYRRAGFTFQGTVGFVFSCDLWSYQLFLSAAISEEMTEMESWHRALYSENTELKPAQLCNSFPYASLSLPFPHLKFGSRFRVSVLSLSMLPAYHSLKSNSSK